jgi:hypothetical protein
MSTRRSSRWSFSSNFPSKVLYEFLTEVKYKLWSSLLRSFLQTPVTSCLISPNVFLCNLLSYTYTSNLCYSREKSSFTPIQKNMYNFYNFMFKVKLKSVSSIKHHAMKTYGRVGV